MKPLNVSEDIVPIGEFKAQAAALLRRIRKTGRPVVVTQSGRPSVVVVSTEEYERLAERERFVEAVQQGLDDVEAARVLQHGEAMAVVKRELGAATGLSKAARTRKVRLG